MALWLYEKVAASSETHTPTTASVASIVPASIDLVSVVFIKMYSNYAALAEIIPVTLRETKSACTT